MLSIYERLLFGVFAHVSTFQTPTFNVLVDPTYGMECNKEGLALLNQLIYTNKPRGHHGLFLSLSP